MDQHCSFISLLTCSPPCHPSIGNCFSLVSADSRWRWSVSMKNPMTNNFPAGDSFITSGRLLFDEVWYEHSSFDTYILLRILGTSIIAFVTAWSRANQTLEEVFLCLQTLHMAFHQTPGSGRHCNESQIILEMSSNSQLNFIVIARPKGMADRCRGLPWLQL